MERGLAHSHAKRSRFRNPEPEQVSSLWRGLLGGTRLQGEKLVLSVGQPLLRHPTQPSAGGVVVTVVLHLIPGEFKLSEGRHLGGFLSGSCRNTLRRQTWCSICKNNPRAERPLNAPRGSGHFAQLSGESLNSNDGSRFSFPIPYLASRQRQLKAMAGKSDGFKAFWCEMPPSQLGDFVLLKRVADGLRAGISA